MASAGDTQSIAEISSKYELRELRNYRKVSGRTQTDYTDLSKQLEMTELEVRACHIAFLAYDIDGSGGLDAGELMMALRGCGISDAVKVSDPALIAAMSHDRTISPLNFLKLCKAKRPIAARTRTKISAFYHSSIVQYTVGLLIVLNFVMVIINAVFNPKDEDNDFKGVLEIFEYALPSLSSSVPFKAGYPGAKAANSCYTRGEHSAG